MGLLKDIFYGNFDSNWMPVTEESRKSYDKIADCADKVKKHIKNKKKAYQLLLDLELANGLQNSIHGEQCFEFGFFFGAHLMMEIFQQDMI